LNLEVRDLRLVEAIAETGSVTQAGTRLHVTQSAASHQLRELERRLGAPLFLRRRRRMVPTAEGELIVEAAGKVLHALSEVEARIRGLGDGTNGLLRLTTECYTCYHWLPKLLRSFGELHPGVDVRIVLEATARPLEALLDGTLDVALVHRPLRDRRVVEAPLFDDEFVAILPPDHPLAGRAYLEPEDFADEHLLVYTTQREHLIVFQQFLAPAGVVPRKVSHLQLTEAILEMVENGIGVSVLAGWAVAPRVEAGALRAVRLTRRGTFRRWSAAYSALRKPPGYLLDFVALLAQSELSGRTTAQRPNTSAGGRRHEPKARRLPLPERGAAASNASLRDRILTTRSSPAPLRGRSRLRSPRGRERVRARSV
jgi:LysR family transcriptional regulator for metE and metH